ncbi:helix-turn-helix domain-containing protein [Geopseudomonas aromaticivorans]
MIKIAPRSQVKYRPVVEDRVAVFKEIRQGLDDGTLTFGGAILQLRKRVTGLNQADFARMCKLSLRSLRMLEQDEGNPTVATLDSIFKPFGMQVGIVQRRPRYSSGSA